MADALRSLAADSAWRARLGANGRRHAEAELSQDVILRRFETQVMALVRGEPAPSQLLHAQEQLK
jgi:colanic acid biosynthesis glycosyl transferase WcaI